MARAIVAEHEAEDGRVRVLPDSDLVTLNDDLRAVNALRAEREGLILYVTSPPFVSMCGHTTAGSPFVDFQESRIRRTSVSMLSRSAALS